MIVDTHAHLTFPGLREDIGGVLSRAREAGVGAVISVGVDPEDSRRAVALARSRPEVWAAVGVHPHDAGTLSETVLDDLSELARQPRVAAWGETGLDYYRDRAPRDLQRKWFRAQAARARELDLPLVVHDREAHADVLGVLKAEAARGLRGVMHCFSGDSVFAREVLKIGFYLSIPGTVTYPKNTVLQDVVREAPLERCLLETDCPYLAPQPYRGKTNEPSRIVHTAAKVAELKGLAVRDVARITTRASRQLFGVGEVEGPRVAYGIRDSLYLNLTDRCTNRCVFCPKHRSVEVKGHDLTLGREPSVSEVLAAVEEEGGAAAWSEVVFCGYGEPLLRLDAVLEIARELKRLGARKIRVNTDGLANLVHGRDVTDELAALVDAVSVSLNAPDADSYERICRPEREGAYPALLDFLRRCKGKINEVTATAVAMPGVDVGACERTAHRLGVKFRVRPYDEMG